MKLRIKFVPPADRAPSTSYLMLSTSTAQGVIHAVTGELQVLVENGEAPTYWQRVELVTLP